MAPPIGLGRLLEMYEAFTGLTWMLVFGVSFLLSWGLVMAWKVIGGKDESIFVDTEGEENCFVTSKAEMGRPDQKGVLLQDNFGDSSGSIRRARIKLSESKVKLNDGLDISDTCILQ